jgi:protein-tyrosine kinase
MGDFNRGRETMASTDDETPAHIVWPPFETLAQFTPDSAVLEQNSIVGFARRDLRSRPFALLRSQVQRRLTKHNARFVGITSATPAAGKTYIAINLASALARVSESPVYLVDFDLRRGMVASQLGFDCEYGIADVLADGRGDLSRVGKRIDGTNLAIYPTRSLDEGSSELLSGENFSQLVDGMRALPRSTTIICDLPPVFAGDDTMITLEKLDGYLLVVDSGQTTARQVTQSIQLLEPTPCLGTILNRYSGGLNDSYGYGQNYGAAA